MSPTRVTKRHQAGEVAGSKCPTTKLIINLKSGDALCVGVLADRLFARMRGLIGHAGLPAGEGILLLPECGIHTAFMRFPIDVLFLDGDLSVLDMVESLPPWRVASRRRARAVLELAAGECARRGVKIGDRLELRDRRPVEEDAVVHAQVRAHGPSESSESIIWPGSALEAGTSVRLQPLRVLVVSSDPHFRSVTSMLLAHRGCSVTTTAKTTRVAKVVCADGPDVVVLDAGQSSGTVQTVAQLRALARPVGIVVVDESVSCQGRPPVLAKWGPFDQLFAAIEQADHSRDGGRVTA
jgi:uncharacterized protein